MWRNYGVVLLALAVLTNAYMTYREDMQLNKTPNAPAIFKNACDECQIVVRRLAEVARDPGKIAEIKAILLVLCDETSYKEECRMFVNRLDLFLDRLLPYLQNPREVCHKLHICSNKKLETLHEIGKFIATDKIGNNAQAASTLLCDECHFAVDELQTIVNNNRYQEEVKEFLSNEICAELGRYRGICDTMLEDFLPDVWQELQDLLKNGNQLCVELKLCKQAQTNIVTASIDSSSARDEDTDDESGLVAVGDAEARQRRVRAKVSKTLISAVLN